MDSDLDPIQKTFKEAPDFNRAWLRTDKPLTNVQRTGFVLLSTIVGLAGAMFLNSGIIVAKEGSFVSGFLMAIPGAGAFCIGILGLWRVTRDLFKSE